MAKPKKAQARGGAGKKKKSGGSAYLFTLIGMIVVGLMVFATPALLLFAIGIVPAMVAMVVDREPGRNATIAVAATNVAGVAPFVVELMINGPTMARAMNMVTDVFVVAVMYGTAGIGWLLVLGMPRIAAVYLSVTNEAKVQIMRREQRRLVEEWGDGVKDPSAA